MQESVDIVVVGFGAAGACAAIEAASAGAEVLVMDRYGGGGATAASGGVVYAGGGTSVQAAAGVKDTPAAMADYLRLEVGDAVSPETLQAFVDDSVTTIDWLTSQGVPFDGSLCPTKTSYPTNQFYLYYSGSERSFRAQAEPAPRGHRAKGPGTSGKLLYARLAAAAVRAGARVRPQTEVVGLIVEDGRVTGVECRTLAGASRWVRARHRLLSKYAAKPGLYVPALRKALTRRATRLEQRHGKPMTVTARRGVVIAAGGFVANREMLRTHAPAYRGGLPLGTSGDDGSGIRLGQSVGGAVGAMDKVSAWRFITPPSALLEGVLVAADGSRVCDESRYGAAIGHELITHHGGRGWLLIDERGVREARRQARSQSLWFQYLQVRYLLRVARVRGRTVAEVAGKVGIDAAGLTRTLDAYNAAPTDPLGKPDELVRPLVEGPFSLIDVSIKPSVGYPCPMLTLGGLRVDERTGQVVREGGGVIEGLYAAGRSAVGICSNSYVSGLSLADCVFSGRRAGRSLASKESDSAHG
ncbi:fumarate reductase/succinate dehydrogenase flavoprotein, N-terminal:FAD dependent oxidoreductase [Alloactinosynnema sp. L-07]|nr:fumarate reductase/succinate dehydrogenase flavoprotein, N-terminal:FAD dependent oxidoreductase [Alloactinosynnema sp. L-07]